MKQIVMTGIFALFIIHFANYSIVPGACHVTLGGDSVNQ